jgi:Tetratricopeptide repeat
MYRQRLFLVITICLAGSLPLISMATASEPPVAGNGASLYDGGKFSESETAYKGELGSSIKAGQLSLEKVARSLLGLGRSQAAQSHWTEAEGSFYHALALAQTAGMPRSFLDEVRAALVEAQLKSGHTASETTSSGADLPPLPVPVPSSTRPITVRPSAWYVHVPHQSGMLIGGQNTAKSSEETEYLHKCSINFCEHVYGPSSINTANAYLDLAQYYLIYGDIAAQSSLLSKLSGNLPNMTVSDQCAVTAPLLELSVRLANSNQPLVASQIAEPVVKMVTPQFGNLTEIIRQITSLSNSFNSRHDYAQAETFQKYAVSLLEKTSSAHDWQLANERVKLAQILDNQNKTASAIELYEMSGPVLENAYKYFEAVDAYDGLISDYIKINDIQKAHDAVGKLVTSINGMRPDAQENLWRPTFLLATKCAESGNMDLCRTVYKAAIAHLYIPEKGMPGSEYQLQQEIRELTTNLESIGAISEAENVYLCLLEARKTAGVDSDLSTASYADIAQFYLKHDNYDKAKMAADHAASNIRRYGNASLNLHRVLELARAFEPQHADEALALTMCAIELTPDPGNIAQIREVVDNYSRAALLEDKLGDHSKATANFEKAIDIVITQWPSSLSTLAPQFTEFVHHQIQVGHLTNASQLLVSVASTLQSTKYAHGDSEQYTLQIMQRLANAYEQAQTPEAALGLYHAILEKQSKEYGESSIQVSGTMTIIANCLRRSGKAPEALQMQEEAQAILDMYNRQNRGERGLYQPFASLKDTVQRYRVQHVSPNSST